MTRHTGVFRRRLSAPRPRAPRTSSVRPSVCLSRASSIAYTQCTAVVVVHTHTHVFYNYSSVNDNNVRYTRYARESRIIHTGINARASTSVTVIIIITGVVNVRTTSVLHDDIILTLRVSTCSAVKKMCDQRESVPARFYRLESARFEQVVEIRQRRQLLPPPRPPNCSNVIETSVVVTPVLFYRPLKEHF